MPTYFIKFLFLPLSEETSEWRRGFLANTSNQIGSKCYTRPSCGELEVKYMFSFAFMVYLI